MVNLMNEDQVAIARAKKGSLPVLLAKLMAARTCSPDRIFAIFEGNDDIGIWPVWFSRCGLPANFEPFPCNGKDRVLELRKRLASNLSFNPGPMLYFVDRDFDENQYNGEDIFVTDRYSIENYFVEENVIEYILNTMFGCAGLIEEKQRIIDIYKKSLDSFLSAISDINFHGFCLRRSRVSSGEAQNRVSYPDKISGIVSLSDNLRFEPHPSGPEAILPLSGELTNLQIEAMRSEFEKLSPHKMYRGKFLKMFLTYFLNTLQEDRNSKNRIYFSSSLPEIKIKYNGLNLSAFSTFSDMPNGLELFLKNNTERELA